MSVFAPARPGTGRDRSRGAGRPLPSAGGRPAAGQGRAAGAERASAFEALRANKGRAVLTALGIIIGVAAVIVMVALVRAPAPRCAIGWPDWGPT